MKLPIMKSVKSTILWMFISILLVFIPFTGFIAYMLASDQLKSNADTSIYDTVSQTKNYLGDRMTALLSDLTAFDNDSEIQALFDRADQPDYALKPQDYIVLSKNMDKVYSDFYTMIDSMTVYYRNGLVSMYRGDYMRSGIPFSPKPYFNDEFKSVSQVYWLNLHNNDLALRKNSGKVASLFKWVRGRNVDKNGIILIQMKEQFFNDILTAPQISKNGYLLLASQDGFMSFKTTDANYDIDENVVRNELLSEGKPSGRMTFENKYHKKIVVLYDTIGINKWKIAAVFPEEELYRKVDYIKYVTLSVVAGVIVMAIVLSGILANNITKPLSLLTRKVNSIEQGNLDVVFHDWPKNEIGVLNKGMKEMLERIKTLLVQVEEEQQKKRAAELSVLQAQIHPHFLYNTLYSIKQLCDMGETAEASQMVSALSNFFRISISKGSEVIPVAHEIDHIKTYLYIQEMRYGGDFKYEIEVPNEMMDCPMIKLTLQPLVENAIYHGVKKTRRPGLIRIVGCLERDYGLFQVMDNGAGMTDDRLASLRKGLTEPELTESPAGFGVRNVHRRLQLHYGLDCGLSYDSKLGEGTVVTVKWRAFSHDSDSVST